MKRIVTSALILLQFNSVNAQNANALSSPRQSQVETIVQLIKEEDSDKLADYVEYPLRRPDPIPDIADKQSFILYYPTLFTPDLKAKLIRTTYTPNNTIDMPEGFGLLKGALWLNEQGKIIAVQRSSDEIGLQKELKRELMAITHPSVRSFKSNVLIAESTNYIVRIDKLSNNSMRFTLWEGNKAFSDTPDVIIRKGRRNGCGEAVTYFFVNGNNSYNVSEDFSCIECGIAFSVIQNGTETNSDKLIKRNKILVQSPSDITSDSLSDLRTTEHPTP